MNPNRSEKHVQAILLVLSLVGLLIIVLTLPPSEAAATQHILAEHPECTDQLRVEERLVKGTYMGPVVVVDHFVPYLVCDIEIVSIEVRIR